MSKKEKLKKIHKILSGGVSNSGGQEYEKNRLKYRILNDSIDTVYTVQLLADIAYFNNNKLKIEECKKTNNNKLRKNAEKTLKSYKKLDGRPDYSIVMPSKAKTTPSPLFQEKYFDNVPRVSANGVSKRDSKTIHDFIASYSITGNVLDEAYEMAKTNPKKFVENFTDKEEHRKRFMVSIKDGIKYCDVLERFYNEDYDSDEILKSYIVIKIRESELHNKEVEEIKKEIENDIQ